MAMTESEHLTPQQLDEISRLLGAATWELRGGNQPAANAHFQAAAVVGAGDLPSAADVLPGETGPVVPEAARHLRDVEYYLSETFRQQGILTSSQMAPEHHVLKSLVAWAMCVERSRDGKATE